MSKDELYAQAVEDFGPAHAVSYGDADLLEVFCGCGAGVGAVSGA